MKTIRILGVMPVIFILLMNGCSSYQLSSSKKEAIVDKISPNAVTVTFCGNAYMNQKEVEKYALQRASVEALSKGCSHFVIVNKEDKSKICSLSSGMGKKHIYSSSSKGSGSLSSSDFVEPNVTLTIRCVPRGEKIPENAINAEQFLNENFPGMNK